MQNSDQTATVPVQGLLAELANQHSQTPKAVVKYHPNPDAFNGKPAQRIAAGAGALERAKLRMGSRSNV